MEEVMGTLLVGVCVILAGILTIYQARLIYDRYLRSYDHEISRYLEEKGFEHHATFSMTSKDWSRSPFKKPPAVQFSWVVIKINGVHVDWTKKDFKRVLGRRDSKFCEFWMQITTTYFQKTEISMYQGKSVRLPEEQIGNEFGNLN